MMDFDKRLQSLQERRQWTPDSSILGTQLRTFASSSGIRKSLLNEALDESSGVKYVINSMSQVDPQATEISIREGQRVADNLSSKLQDQDEYVIKKFQGSVPLNIHIKGHSDIDVLIINKNTILVENPEVYPGSYTASSDKRTLVNVLRDIRSKSEEILPKSFPAVDVDISGNKAISLSGGSLARKVDIVPAVWYDCRAYQRTQKDHDRGIKIYHKRKHNMLLNYPFTHIKKVHTRDIKYNGNLKYVIRLMKTIIADMGNDKKSIAKQLSSYDLAAIGYHMEERLIVDSFKRLGLVEITRVFLEDLLESREYRTSLEVPDESRKIFNNNSKTEALELLLEEYNDLVLSLVRELRPFQQYYNPDTILQKSVS